MELPWPLPRCRVCVFNGITGTFHPMCLDQEAHNPVQPVGGGGGGGERGVFARDIAMSTRSFMWCSGGKLQHDSFFWGGGSTPLVMTGAP